MSMRDVGTGALFGAALVGALMACSWLVELLGETDPPVGSSQRYVLFIVVVLLTGSMGGFVLYGVPILVLVVLTLIPIPDGRSPGSNH